MNERKHMKSLSDLFQSKARNDYALICAKFLCNLEKDISSAQNIDPVLNTLLKSDGNSSSFAFINGNSAVCSKGQSTILCELISSVPEEYISGHAQLLSRLLGSGCYTDLVLKVENEEFLVHKDILCVRSPYFGAMLNIDGRWSEANSNCIVINDIAVKAFSVYLCHIYGVFIDASFIDMPDIYNLVKVADMFASDDFKTAVDFFIRRDKCHFFHKPCSECIESMSIAIQISDQFNMEKLKRKCLKWATKNFGRLWPTRSFCGLPFAIHRQCHRLISESLNIHTVVGVALETDGLLGHLSPVKWAEPINKMANELLSECQEFMARNLFQLTNTKNLFPLLQGMGSRRNMAEHIFEQAAKKLSTKNACLHHIAVQSLLEAAEKEQWTSSVCDSLKSLDQRISTYLTNNYYAAIHSDHWSLLSPEFQNQLKENTLCLGDPVKKPRHKPVLSSSPDILISDSTNPTPIFCNLFSNFLFKTHILTYLLQLRIAVSRVKRLHSPKPQIVKESETRLPNSSTSQTCKPKLRKANVTKTRKNQSHKEQRTNDANATCQSTKAQVSSATECKDVDTSLILNKHDLPVNIKCGHLFPFVVVQEMHPLPFEISATKFEPFKLPSTE